MFNKENNSGDKEKIIEVINLKKIFKGNTFLKILIYMYQKERQFH
nr:hypothetical protein [Leptotrichia sp. OH3620_COT-345]